MAKKKFVSNRNQVINRKSVKEGATFTADDEDKDIKYLLAGGRIGPAPAEKKPDPKEGEKGKAKK